MSSRAGRAWHRASGGSIAGGIALGVLMAILLVAMFGPWFAPHTASEIVGIPFAGRSGEHLLGTDFLGRDVFSRVLNGGRSAVLLSVASTVFSYVIGGTVGIVAGFKEGRVDSVLMRSIDVLLAFPPILFLLVIAAGLGPSAWTLVFAITIVFVPSVARVMRAGTQEVSRKGYVEAAVARGESTPHIVFREILPNLRTTIVADAGPRLTFAILLVAAVNYLGLGLRPPAADWALMISENRAGLDLQPWSLGVPAALIAVLTVAVNVVADQVSQRIRVDGDGAVAPSAIAVTSTAVPGGPLGEASP